MFKDIHCMQLHDILNAKWLINTDVILSYIPYFFSFLNGGSIDWKKIAGDNNIKPYCLAEPINTAHRFDLQDQNLPENSIAIIPIQDVITSDKSMLIEMYIRQAIANPNVIAILFMVSTPGGMVLYTDILAKFIKDCPLPTVAYVVGYAASSGAWLISGTNRIIASSPLDTFGSIGVMTSFTDIASFLKTKLNIDIFDVYATKSTRKNEITRALQNTSLSMEDRTKLVTKELDFVNEFFHSAIRENLGIKEDSEVFTGASYHAQDAISLGLAHEINTLDYALSTAQQLGIKSKINQLFTNLKR